MRRREVRDAGWGAAAAGLTGNFDAMLTNRMCVCGDFRKQLLFVLLLLLLWLCVARCTLHALCVAVVLVAVVVVRDTMLHTHTSDNNKNTGRQKKKKGEQAQQNKDTLHTRTHDSRTLHAQWAHTCIVFVIARCSYYCCWYCSCCCLVVLLSCVVLHTKRRRHTRWQSEREKCSKTRLVRAVG